MSDDIIQMAVATPEGALLRQEPPIIMRTKTPIASRRGFLGLGGGVLAATLSVSAGGATPPEVPAVPAPGDAFAKTRYWTIDVGGLEIFYREAGPGAAPA
jgi:hypothetical protein